MFGAKPSPLPPPLLSRETSWKPALAESVERREVRSEAELRQAIQEIAAETAVSLSGETGATLASIKPRSRILIAAPFSLSAQVTIPSTCTGLELAADGWTPLQIGNLAVAFLVEAQFVTFSGLRQTTPADDTPPTVFCDLDGADYFTSVDCFCGGQTAAFRTPSGGTVSNQVSFRGYRGASNFLLNTDDGAYVDCHFKDVSQYGDRNRYVACRFSDYDDLTAGGDHNIASGCAIDNAPTTNTNTNFDTTNANVQY